MNDPHSTDPFGPQPPSRGPIQPNGPYSPSMPPAAPPMPPMPPGYQPMAPGYSANPYGAGGYPAEYPNGTTILLLGILGLIVCQVLSPIAWVMGHNARKAIASTPGVQYSNQGSVTAGWVMGIIGTVLLILTVVLFVVFILIGIAAAGSTTTGMLLP